MGGWMGLWSVVCGLVLACLLAWNGMEWRGDVGMVDMDREWCHWFGLLFLI